MNAKKKVKRTYRSSLREDQAGATRLVIIAAAAELFARDGYAAVSMDAIAEAAGVSRPTIFNSVGGKATLLKEAYAAAFGQAAGSQDQAMPLVERPRSRRVRSEPTALGYIAAYSELFTAICHHVAQIHETLREAARADADAREHLERIYAERRRGAATIVADVKQRSPLRPGLNEELAADAVWALIDPSWYHLLVHRRGWSEQRFREWLAHTLAGQLLKDSG